jgi:hypothetical protein
MSEPDFDIATVVRVPVAESLAQTPSELELTRRSVPTIVADAGATDVRTPSPNAATATSATRLKFVFVDMFFLSLVRFRNFLDLARRSFDLLIPFLL